MLGPVFGQRCRIFLRMQYRLQEGRRRVVLGALAKIDREFIWCARAMLQIDNWSR